MRFARRSPAAFVVALILLSAQASEALHQLVVQHATCPEHGDVVEGGATDQGASPRPGDALAAQARLSGTTTGAPHAHDSCLAALGDNDAVARDASPPFHVAPPGAALPSPAERHERRARVPLFRLAPKTSPPA